MMSKMRTKAFIFFFLFTALSFSIRADWLISTYRNGNAVNNLSDADALISSTAPIASTNIAEADLLGENPGSGPGRFSVNNPIPGIPQNQTTPNYAVQGTGFLEIAVAGNYTFALNTDDGARLRIDGMDVIVDNSQHGPSDSAYVTTNLSVGLHAVEWTWFNAGGGAEGEAFATPGQSTSFNANFMLLGDPNGIPVVQTYVALPPYIVVQPASQFVQAGSNATFTVVANGQQPLFYQWFFNNALIPAATNATLTLNSIGITNAGLYSLMVSNSVGVTNSVAASLNIYAAILGQGWLVKTYRNGSSVNGLADADALISGDSLIASTNMAQGDMLGFNSGEGTGHFSINNPVPSIPNNIATDNYAVQGTGYLVIPSDGQYTFGLNTDDGARLTIDGINIIVDNVRSPPHDSPYATVLLSAGLHPIVWTWYNEAGGNNGGGAEGEIFAAPGVYSGFDSSFQLVGSAPGLLVAQTYSTPVLVVQTNRTPTTNEITPQLAALPTTSQLLAYHGGIFTTNLASVDPNQPTIVLTHGWIPLKPSLVPPFNLIPVFTPNGVDDWPTTFAAQLRANGVTANIVAWDWSQVARSLVDSPGIPEQQTGDQGRALGQALLLKLGANYSQPVQFIGHSLGTLVNASAANYLQGTSWGTDNGSPTPWPAMNMLMTLFDEAEVARGNSSFAADIDTLQGKNGNPLASPPKATDHPLPKQFAWAENYIAAFGLLQTNAANVILTNEFPANANNLLSWFDEIGAFHGYPMDWYSNTIASDDSAMGFVWPLLWSLRDPAFANAPTNGSVYVQAFNTSQWDLTATNWNYGTNLLAARFQAYRNGLYYSLNGETLDQAIINGNGSGQNIVGALPAWNNFWLHIFTTNTTVSQNAQPMAKAMGVTANDVSSGANIPAYAWLPIFVPTNAVSMSFDYIIQGDWQSDSLAAAFNGTNVLSLPGSEIETNVLFSSGQIDVSAFAGQTNEFFIGIVGGTSTNAQVTVENLAFSISSPPSLQAQASGNNLILAWPLSVADYNLQSTTNLADPNSWTTLTNVPAVVNLQNSVTNSVSGGAQFYRLMK